MKNRYKIILSNNNLYKEIELTPDATHLRIGTALECDVRLRKELFFDRVELQFVKNGADWTMQCGEGLYITVGDVRKLMTKKLTHGDLVDVKYQDSDNLAFALEFVIDFDNGQKKYERCIDLSGASILSIGTAPSSNIVLSSPYVKNDAINLRKENVGYSLYVANATYGVYVNGRKIQSNIVLKDGDFLSVSDYFFYLRGTKLYTEIRRDIAVNGLQYADYPVRNSYPKFNRNTRVKTVVCDEKIEILDPPTKPQKPKNNLFMRLLPSMGMLLAAGIMASFGGSMIIMSAISGLMAVFTTIMSITTANKDYKEKEQERLKTYNAYIAKKREEIGQCRQQEQAELEEVYVSQNVATQRLADFSTDLFDRTPEDEDYLCVRLGSGEVTSKREINYKKQERLEVDDELQLVPEQICEEYKKVANAPIVCDLKTVNAIGVVGMPGFRFSMLKNIVIDLAARQFFSDVKMVFVAESQNKDQIRWLRFLPHVYNDDIKVRNLVCDDESKNLIFEYLYKELTFRAQDKSPKEHIVIFFYDEYGFKSHPISKFVEKAKDLGVTFVFFGQTAADIPQGCGYLVSIEDDRHATLINTQDQGDSVAFEYPTLQDVQAEQIVKLLAPVYTEEISLEGTLTKNISMFELLNILAVDDIDLTTRWETSQVFKSMAAPLGVSKTGVVNLDLHDKAHGPHGLVAGTTGSGKSEILQTYILAMSTLFHPYEVGFVIIDFKGGGMVNQFKELPHLLGAITNIDGKEINRSLKSIKAELQKRQRLFAEADVNHIDKYIRKYKAREVTEPLPHLIIIVDEFAELKAEQPEFMKELISAARIGRSLGVHLILATQKPSGQVNEQIWSNSRFKLCLKVQSQEDSNEVLKSPLAAEIKEPGRAYLQVGNNEIFELFQSAYSGAPEKTDDANVKEFSIYALSDSGKRVPVYTQKKRGGSEGSTTQLDAIVNYVAEYCRDINLQKLPDICLPSLPLTLPFESKTNGTEYGVCFGRYDAPERQYQGEASLNLAEQNVVIIGSSQTGKTNLLQVLIKALATQYDPRDVNIYIADFGTMILKNFEALHHVGGVVCANDGEKLKNMFKMFRDEMARRKEMLLRAGVSSFVSYREAGYTDMPLMVLMIDNLNMLKELYLSDSDPLLNICREGLAVGISVVATNSQVSGIGYKYMSNFEGKVALSCNDAVDYASLFGNAKLRPDNAPGRCVIEIEKELYEAQVYLAFEGEKEYQRVEKIRQFVQQTNQRALGHAARIPVIPNVLTSQYMEQNYERKPNAWTLGLGYDDIMPACLELTTLYSLGIIVKQGEEQNNIIRSIVKSVADNNAALYLMDNLDAVLVPYSQAPQTVCYAKMAGKYTEAVNQIALILKERYDKASSEDDYDLSAEQMIVMLVNGNDFQDAIAADRTVLDKFKQMLSRYKNMRFCFIQTGIENSRIPIMGADVLKIIRDNNKFLILEDLRNLKAVDLPPALLRKYKEDRAEHDAYLFMDNDLSKIKLSRIVQQ